MAFWNLSTLHLSEFKPGIMSIAERGSDLIMVCMEIGPGREDTGHSHPFDQCGMVLEGQIEMFIGKERRMLAPQECYFIPSGEVHGWKTSGGPAKLLDVSLQQP